MVWILFNRVMGVKHERFKRIRDKRLPLALRRIALLERLGSYNQAYSAAEARQVISDLRAAVAAVERALRRTRYDPSR